MEESIETMQDSSIATQNKERKLDNRDEVRVKDEPERKKQKTDEDAPIISSYYNHNDSDITLVSSNRVHFKVHAGLLRRVSLMLRESLPPSAPQGGYDLITLSDPDIESSVVLEKFLDLIYPVPHHDLSHAMVYQKVIQLARKWECLHALESLYNAVLVSVINARISSSQFSFASRCDKVYDCLFIIAAGLEDMGLLENVMAQCSSLTWTHTWCDRDYLSEGRAATVTRNGMPGMIAYPRAFELGAWTLDHYTLLPPEMIWCVIYSRQFQGVPDWDIIAARFADLLGKRYDQPVIGVGPATISELAALRPLYRQHPRADLSFPFANTWGQVHDEEEDDAISRQEAEKRRLDASLTDPVPHGRYDDEDADTTVISSDNVSFRVHSVILRKASPVFSSLLSLGSAATMTGPLVFTDTDMENSTMIEAMLDAIYHSRTLSFEDEFSYLIPTLVDLADKWEVESVRQLVRSALMTDLYLEEGKTFDLFVLAVRLKAYDIVERTIKLGHSNPIIRILVGLEHDYPAGDYNAMSSLFDSFRDVPPKVAWALQRAGLMWDHGYERDSETERSPSQEARRWGVVADHFRQIMDPSYDGCYDPPPRGSRGSWDRDHLDDSDDSDDEE